ncbi:hypothetical protein [Methylobacterium fujisawaense]|uniref:hypothetical protein n=1 Tax=Methylobacterium fujisawaense TaxID=107400 RepID=UPI0036F99D4E
MAERRPDRPSTLQAMLLSAASRGPFGLDAQTDFDTVLAVLQLYRAGHLEPLDGGDPWSSTRWRLTQRGRALARCRGAADASGQRIDQAGSSSPNTATRASAPRPSAISR